MKILFLKLFLISTFIDPNFVKYFTNLAENPLKTLTLRSSWSSFFPSLSASVKRFSVFRVQDFIISYIISRKYRISKPTALQIVYLKRIDNFFLDNLTILEVLNLLNNWNIFTQYKERSTKLPPFTWPVCGQQGAKIQNIPQWN